MKKIEVYIVAHKKFNVPLSDGYIPIQVGDDKPLGFVRDDTGDNISVKNKNYCELTAAYWIWKNSKAAIKGIVHYRRYFVKRRAFQKKDLKNIILKMSQIDEMLSTHDIIVPKKLYIYKTTIAEHYKRFYQYKDYISCRKAIKKIYPQYLQAFDMVSESHELYICNMMIANANVFDAYHKWLFRILFEVEKNTDLTQYDTYQKRVYGFLSERLFNVWLVYNKPNIQECSFLNIENKNEFRPVVNYIKGKVIKFKSI